MKLIVSFLVSISLIISQLSAYNLGNIISQSETKASKWTSPTTGATYYYSGSYEFTFNANKNFTPWFNGAVPSFQMGCNGFSIKGGFMSLLGLNAIKDQLSEAGPTLAWGVMLALISSVPIIADTFKKIREWAREIQKLLANACNIGRALAEKHGVGKLRDSIENSIKESNLGKALDNARDGIDGMLDTVTEWTSNLNTCLSQGKVSVANDCSKKLSNLPTENNSKKISKVSRYSFISNLVSSRLSVANTDPTNKIYIGDLKGLLENGKIAGYTVGNFEDIKSIIVFSKLFFGDFGVNTDSFMKLLKDTDCTSIESGKTCKLVADKDKIMEKLTGNVQEIEDAGTYISPLLSSKGLAAKFLLYGFSDAKKDGINVCNSTNHTCKVPNNLVAYVDYTGNAGDSTKDSSAIKYIVQFKKYNKTIDVAWEGAIEESAKKIRFYVKKSSKVDPQYGIFENSTATVDENSIVPLVVPGIGKYIKIIAKIERKEDKETMFTASLKELLAKYNAYLFSRALIDYLEGKYISAIGDNVNGGVNPPEFTKIKEDLVNTKKEIQSQLDEILKENNYFKNIAEIFEKIEKDYNEKVTNSLK